MGGAVVVELFSSQGCATSPEAELLSSRVGKGDFNLEVPVILFGSSQWTVRQKAYVEALNLDTMFTPQVVVQGQAQCVANEQDALLSCIASAPRYAAPTFQATFERPSPDSLQVSLTGALRNKVDNHGADIMVALYESGLVTDCPNGANIKGRVLTNDFVVRRLQKLSTVNSKTSLPSLSPLWVSFDRTKCGVAVFVETASHHIFASQNIQLPGNL